MAQLPVLIYDQKPPMSSFAFKELATGILIDKDAELMKQLSLEPYTEDKGTVNFIEKKSLTGCEFIDKWWEWERTFRLNLAKNRAYHLKKENILTYDLPVVPIEAANAALKAMASDFSPMEAEVFIDKARWMAVCSLVGHDYFNRNNVFAYYLKIVLMERRVSFNTEKGFAEYKSLYSSILEKSEGELK